MAHLKSPVSLITILLYCSFPQLLLFSYFPQKTQATFHNVEISSLSPAPTCSRPAPNAPNTRKHSTTLELFHRHGPCSPHYDPTKNKLSLADILLHDQSRVNSIQARLRQNPLENQYKGSKANLPIVTTPDDGIYLVTVGLGTPQQNQTLLFDTGSEFTWTQCKPCLGYCYDGPCVYHIRYGDGSYSVGTLSKERLTVTRDVFPGFVFGCGQKNIGLFYEYAGILGLGRDPNNGSFLDQTSQKYKLVFSYCIPSTESSTGHLTFGRSECKRCEKDVFTPFIPDQDFYLVEVVSISVGNTRLPINNQSSFQNPGTLVDSGTIIGRLPPDVYKAMKYEFRKQMNKYKKYPIVPGDELLDTCFDVGNDKNIKIPKISFTFKGGAEVDLGSIGTIYNLNGTVWCLAFAGNSDPKYLSIIGVTQQKTIEVVFDVAREKLAFRPNGCK